MKKIVRNSILLLIGSLSFIMHYEPFSKDIIGAHVWRQTETQSTIINFYEEDMNILNPRRNDRGDTDGIFRIEFPLMQWLIACLYKVFGNHLLISRIFVFIIGLISVFGMYKLLYTLFHNEVISLIGAWTFNFSPSFYYFTISPMPDNLALCCSIWGMVLFFGWYRKERPHLLLLGGLLLGIGALCKLPYILYFVVPASHFLLLVFRNGLNKKIISQAVGILGFSILPMIWYIAAIPHWNGNIVIKGMLGNQETFMKILDYLQFNLISTLPELMLNYGSVIFFLAGFYFLFHRKAYKDSRFPLILAWSIVVLAYFLFEVNAIKKVHDYYLWPFYPLLFILVSYGAYHLISLKTKFTRYITIILLLLLPLLSYLRIQGRWDDKSVVFNKDLLTYKNDLRNAVSKKSLVVAGNDESRFIFFYYIDKRGWGFDYDNLSAQQLKSMIEKGAEYLYTDSRKVDSNEEIICLLDKLILEKGSIRVYSLRKPSP